MKKNNKKILTVILSVISAVLVLVVVYLIFFSSPSSNNLIVRNDEVDKYCEAIINDEVTTVNDILNNNPEMLNDIIDGERPIFIAAENNSIKVIKLFLEKGVNINEKSYNHISSLLEVAIACRANEVAQYLIEKNINVNTTNAWGASPIILATFYGDEEIVNMIVDKSDLKVTDGNGNNLLHMAAYSGKIELYKLFLEKGVNPLDLNLEDNLPICYSSNLEMLKYVLEESETFLEENKQMSFEIFKNTSSTEIVEYLVVSGYCDINQIDEDGNNGLYFAYINGNYDVFEKMILMGIDVNNQNKFGDSILHITVMESAIEYIELLLKNNSDVSIKNLEGNSALDIAENLQVEEVLSIIK